MSFLSKLASLGERKEGTQEVVQPADGVMEVPRIMYAVQLSWDKELRVCNDLLALEQVILDSVRGYCERSNDRNYGNLDTNNLSSGDCILVYKSEKEDVFPPGTHSYSGNFSRFKDSKYFEIDIKSAVLLYYNGLCTPGYLMAWSKREFCLFDNLFLNMLGIRAGDGSYKFTILELERYLTVADKVFDHNLMLSYLSSLSDKDSSEMADILDCLSQNIDEVNPEDAVHVVDALSESPAWSGSMGRGDTLVERAEYMSGLKLDEINPFQNIYMFAYKWFSQKQLSVTLEDERNRIEGRASQINSLIPDRPAPLWAQQELSKIHEKRVMYSKVQELLSEACNRIEDSCRVDSDDTELLRKEIERGLASDELSELAVCADCRHNPILALISDMRMLQFAAKVLLDSDKTLMYPVSSQRFVELLILKFSELSSNTGRNFFTLEQVRLRMPNLDNLSRLYVLVEKQVVTEQVSNQYMLITELEKQLAKRFADQGDQVILSLRVDDEKSTLEELREREVVLLELAKELEDQSQDDYANDTATLKKFASIAVENVVEPSDSEKKVLDRYGLLDWLNAVSSGSASGLTSLSLDERGLLGQLLATLSTLTAAYYPLGFRFCGWGISPNKAFKPSLAPGEYKDLIPKLPADSDISLKAHPVFVDDNLTYFNEFNYIRNVGACADSYQDSLLNYLTVLQSLKEMNTDCFMALFSDRDTYRSLCGNSLTEDGLDFSLVRLMQINSELENCTSIIQREMLQKSRDFEKQHLSEKASVLLAREEIIKR